MDNLFAGLEDLGFKDVNDLELYKKEQAKVNAVAQKKEVNINDILFDKSYKCPVCSNEFKARAVKAGKTKRVSQDSDLLIRYDETLNPLFYDVILCPRCGYAALIKYFEKLRNDQIEAIKTTITPKYRMKTYPEVYDLDIAIERLKFALLNTVVKNGRVSEKAYICLKLGWLSRLKEDTANEMMYLEQAHIGFKDAFEKESFPICDMDTHTLTYLIGELARKLGHTEEALQWLGRVIIAQGVNPRLKELAKDQKDLIK